MSSVSDWDNQYAQLARAASQFRTSGLPTTSSRESDLQAFTAQGQRLKSQLPALQTYLTPAEYKRRETLIQSLMVTATSKSSTAAALQEQDAMIDELGVGVGRLKNQTQLISDEARLHTNLLLDMENNVEAAQYSLNQETRRAELVRENQSVWRLQLIVAGLVILFILLILMGLSQAIEIAIERKNGQTKLMFNQMIHREGILTDALFFMRVMGSKSTAENAKIDISLEEARERERP